MLNIFQGKIPHFQGVKSECKIKRACIVDLFCVNVDMHYVILTTFYFLQNKIVKAM